MLGYGISVDTIQEERPGPCFTITQAAMRMLASAGVLVGFCAGGGTPLLMANEVREKS